MRTSGIVGCTSCQSTEGNSSTEFPTEVNNPLALSFLWPTSDSLKKGILLPLEQLCDASSNYSTLELPRRVREREGMDKSRKQVGQTKKWKREKVKKSKKWGREWTGEERQEKGNPCPTRGIQHWKATNLHNAIIKYFTAVNRLVFLENKTIVMYSFRNGITYTGSKLEIAQKQGKQVPSSSTVVERRSLAGKFSPTCARPAAGVWLLMWVNHLL